MTGTLREGLCTFMIKSRRIILRMGMFQTNVVEKIKTHMLHSIFFFENHADYEIIRKNM